MSTRKAKPVVVEQDPESPVPRRVLAKEIAALGSAAVELLRCGLDEEDLEVIVHRRAKGRVSITDVRHVLEAVKDLGRRYAVKG